MNPSDWREYLSVSCIRLAAVGAALLIAPVSMADEPGKQLYTDDELRWLLIGLNSEARYASLSIVQQGLAVEAPHVGVVLRHHTDGNSMGTISVGMSFTVSSPEQVTEDRCKKIRSLVTRKMLGGDWKKFTDQDGKSTSSTSSLPTLVPGEKSNFDQLLGIELKMRGYVVHEPMPAESFPQRVDELKRYIPVYNALLFRFSIYFDTGGSNVASQVSCSNIR